MTKFEEELFNKVKATNIELTTEAEYKKSTLINHFKNWHSDEEFQELKEQNENQAESILLMLDEIKSHKSQLQQQALPVVPEDVDKAIKYLKTKNNFATITDLKKLDILTEKGFWWLNDFQFKDRRFGFGGLNNKLFILSHLAITGYTVEKPQLEKPQMFYLREKNTGHYLRKTGNNEYEITPHYSNDYDEKYMHYKFTQQEIDSMETGSYELVPVEDGE